MSLTKRRKAIKEGRIRMKVVPVGEQLGSQSNTYIELDLDFWRHWISVIEKEHIRLSKEGGEPRRNLWDVHEAQECGEMSGLHLLDYLKYTYGKEDDGRTET